MMRNKNGFTLIEVIGAVIILGIIAIIAIQFFTKSENKFRNDYYDTIETNFLTSGKEFYSDNRIYRPTGIFDASKVTLNTLEGEKYTDEILDYEGNSCNSDSYVIVINMGHGEYLYNACLKCEDDEFDNTIDNKYCNSAWLDPTVTTTKTTLEKPEPIYVYKGTPRDEVRELTAIRASIVKLDYEGNVLATLNGIESNEIPKIYPDNIDVIDTSKLGTYKVTYTYEGKSEEGEIIVYENGAPYVSIDKENVVRRGTVTTDKTTEVSDYVSGEWGQKLIISFGQGSDNKYSESGTRVSRYQWKRGDRWIDLCSPSNGDECEAIITEEMNETVYFRALDNLGNISLVSDAWIFRIDNTLPKCELQLSGTMGNNDWYVSDVNVSFVSSETRDLINKKNEAISGVSTTGITLSSIGTSQLGTQSEDTSSVTWYGYVEDIAENSSVCNITFKRDATKPYATWDPDLEGPHNNNDGITATGTCKDDLSGPVAKTESFSISSPSNGENVSISCTDNAGNTATLSKTYYVRYYSQDDDCGWNDCLTGHNTCEYGCGSCPDSYTLDVGCSGSEASNKSCASGYSIGNCRQGGGTCVCTCTGTTSCNCDPCYTGENTCEGGYNSCWHY